MPRAPLPDTPPADIAAWLRSEALALGFHRAGIAPPAPGPGSVEAYRRWLDAGRHGQMRYLESPAALARRADPALSLSGVRSVLVVTHRYAAGPGAEEPHARDLRRAVVARYARGADYHEVVRPRLEELHRRLEARLGRPVPGRAYADTGPLLERDLGRRAGLGWIGRNTMLLHPRAGSWEVLGVLLLALDLPPDPPFEGDHCGSCRRCVEACPTGALLDRDEHGAPVMDARRCIAYLTIELRDPIPRDLRPLVGNRVFGCDICQEVCPFNVKAPREADPAYRPREGLDGEELSSLAEEFLSLSSNAYLRRFADSPLSRPRRSGMLRNLMVGLGNARNPGSLPVLLRGLRDRQPLVRGHAAWGVGEVGGAGAREALEAAAVGERDAWVQEEIAQALRRLPP